MSRSNISKKMKELSELERLEFKTMRRIETLKTNVLKLKDVIENYKRMITKMEEENEQRAIRSKTNAA